MCELQDQGLVPLS